MTSTDHTADTEAFAQALATLALTIERRAGDDPEHSYTARLLADGRIACARKLAEEAIELALALSTGSTDDIASEAADLCYHLLVALRSGGVHPDKVAACLRERRLMSGLEEKARRPGKTT